MARKYTHVEAYTQQIEQMRKEGKTYRQIANVLGFKDKEVVKNYYKRKSQRQRKLDAGIAVYKRGSPTKDSEITSTDKAESLRYQLARKDARIKHLEMENELMRDFLKETGRK